MQKLNGFEAPPGSPMKPDVRSRRAPWCNRAELAMKKNMTICISESSGNVFADLGFAYPEQELLKANLTLQIYRAIKKRGLTQVQTGETLGIKQPNVSHLMCGQSGTFSVERLLEFLKTLG